MVHVFCHTHKLNTPKCASKEIGLFSSCCQLGKYV